MIVRTAAAVLLLSLVALAALAPDWEKMTAGAEYPLADAIAKGLAVAGEGVPFHAELEWDEGRAVYSIDVAQGTKILNVVLDPKTGALIEKEVDDEDASAVAGALRIPLGSAIAGALAAVPGAAVAAEAGFVDGKSVVGVRVFADGKIRSVVVDGETGRVLSPAPAEPAFTETFPVDADEWTSVGRNRYFVLDPGYALVLEGKEDGKPVRLTITVLEKTRTVDGVETRVVEECERVDDEIVEVSRNYFAMSKRTGSVYYFGEEVDLYEGGKVVGHEGAWLSGQDGARYGLMMPGTALIGARYYQEIAPGVAMDRAEITAVEATFETPAGTFEHCLVTRETTPLESGAETKVHAPGIGLVKDGALRLVSHGRIDESKGR